MIGVFGLGVRERGFFGALALAPLDDTPVINRPYFDEALRFGGVSAFVTDVLGPALLDVVRIVELTLAESLSE